MSHNILKWLSPDIQQLWYVINSVVSTYSSYTPHPHSQLQKLNVEGNQLEGFPPGLMQLPLRQLNTEGNFLHMLFWSRNVRNQPQVRKPYKTTMYNHLL